MNINYNKPLSQAWLRMKIMLFRPFNMGTWFALGFTAFLASLAESGSGGSGNLSNRLDRNSEFEGLSEFFDGFSGSIHDLVGTGLGVGLALFLGLVIVIVSLLVLWVSSRGRFMFLDNLVHKRTEISRPWSEFAAQGDSLFLWQIVFTIIALAVGGLFVLLGISIFIPVAAADLSWIIITPLVVIAGTIAFIFLVIYFSIDFFLTAFVVPIMHKNRIGTMEAWAHFLKIFREHPGSFILCGFFYGLLNVVGLLAFMIGGVLTCCIGLVLMAIPYLGSVITLPLAVTLRYFTLDFLGQFGDEFVMLEPVTDLGNNSAQFNNDRTMIGTEDIGEDGSSDEPGPQDGRD